MESIIFRMIAAVLLVLGAGVAAAQTAPQPVLEMESLEVVSGETRHEFMVEIADDPVEVATGMMGRESMADDVGMLFDLGGVREASFWMKDVLIPLDMVFIDESGQVVAIAENAVPGSVRRINPGVPVRGVLELRGGLSAELALAPGDQVRHRLFEGEESAG
ncbi:MAG: DUF192 domain-containing protein [Pseudomonadota bacterium]